MRLTVSAREAGEKKNTSYAKKGGVWYKGWRGKRTTVRVGKEKASEGVRRTNVTGGESILYYLYNKKVLFDFQLSMGKLCRH
jgi:hypothetical protein